MKTRVYISTTFWAVMLLLVVVSFRPRAAFGQPRLELEQQLGCTGHEILVAINASNLTDVGSFSIFIEVDTAGVDFVATENVFQGLLTGNLVSSITYDNQPIIVINWFSMVPFNIESGKLLDIRLKVKAANSSLIFASNCELTKSDLSVVPEVVYVNGAITPLVSLQPSPATVKITEAQSIGFALPVIENASYQWQVLIGDAWNDLISSPNYEGINESSLRIKSVEPSPLDQYYRCKIGLQSCTGYSGVSNLKVSLLGGFDVNNAPPVLMKTQLSNAQQSLRVDFFGLVGQQYTLKVFMVDGKAIMDRLVDTKSSFCEISTIGWTKGFYIVSLYNIHTVVQTQKIVIL